MGVLTWVRGLFRPDPDKLAEAEVNRKERLQAVAEAQASRAEAEAIAHQFPHIPPHP